jgi:hypothetical protein
LLEDARPKSARSLAAKDRSNMPRGASPKRNDRMKTVTEGNDLGDYNTIGHSEKSYKR